MTEEEKKEMKKKLGKTLCLPKTDFPMRGNLPEKEPQILEEVFNKDLYKKILEKNKGAKPFHLHDGPPYANGDIHIGHALNKILKDIIVRYKALNGFYTPYVPGFDTHGLPTEIKAIEKLKLNKDEIPVDVFRDTCKKFAEEYIKKQTASFKRLGVLGDWENPYITYNPKMEVEEIDVFADMYFKGYIYQGLKPVHWCTHCETALAEAEIEYKDIEGDSIYVKFPVKDSKGLFNEDDAFAVIWTTTPWTLPGNEAVIAGPNLKYVLIEVKRDRREESEKYEKYLVLRDLKDEVIEKIGADKEDVKVLDTFASEEIEGIKLKHPFLEKEIKIYLGSKTTVDVDTKSGTGLVHCAPGYGNEDYKFSLGHKELEVLVAVDEKGHQTEKAGKYNGMYYKKSNKEIKKDLQESGMLLFSENRLHSYPHCWRCKNEIIYRAAKQWFASIDKFREKTLDEIKKVKWYPAWGEKRISKMIEDRNDWCISRQRTWGVPIPVIYCKKCGKPHITKNTIEIVKKLILEEGSNSWWMKDVKEIFKDEVCEECGSKDFVKETDIMDVWFDSGTTHRSVIKNWNLPEIDMYLEGNDQYRGWFQSSLLTSVATTNKAPYKEVLTNGFLVDEKGNKMSKSLGNVVDPADIIKTKGADIIRLWVSSTDYQSDVSISENILNQVAENYRKIRNTVRYILGNLSDFDPNKDAVDYESLEELDKWALDKLNKLIKDVSKAYDAYAFNKVYLAINEFIVNNMSAFYLDIIKDRLYIEHKEGNSRRAAQTAIFEILNTLFRLLSPVISYSVEEIWKYIPKRKEEENIESVMLLNFPKEIKAWNNKEAREKIDYLKSIKEFVSKELETKRAEKEIGGSLDAKVMLYIKDEVFEKIKEDRKLLEDILIVSKLELLKLKELDSKILEKIQKESEKELEMYAFVVKENTLKCERCWKYDEKVGENEEELPVCPRCYRVLKDMNFLEK